MTRRRCLWLCLLLLLAALLLLPAVHWRLIGWVKGEAFYQGRPTSWWREEVRRYPRNLIEGLAEGLEVAEVDDRGLGIFWQELLGKPPARAAYQPLLAGGADAVHVLTELLNDPEERVREGAGAMLKDIDPVRP